MRKSTRYGPTYDRGPRISADLDDVRSSRGLAACGTSPAQVGYIRLGPLMVPNSGKPEFGRGEVNRDCCKRGERECTSPSACTKGCLRGGSLPLPVSSTGRGWGEGLLATPRFI